MIRGVGGMASPTLGSNSPVHDSEWRVIIIGIVGLDLKFKQPAE